MTATVTEVLNEAAAGGRDSRFTVIHPVIF